MNIENEQNRRKFLRLDSVFPVQFRFLSFDQSKALSDWFQGFTHNLSSGGLLLDINNIPPNFLVLLKEKDVTISLKINIPVRNIDIEAVAKVAWLQQNDTNLNNFSLGVNYISITPTAKNILMRFVWAKKLFFPFVFFLVLFLSVGFALNGYINMKLVKGNKALVSQLVSILQDSVTAKQKIKQITAEKEDLQLKIQALQVRIQDVDTEKKSIEEKYQQQEEKAANRMIELNAVVEKLTKEEAQLQQQLINLQNKESVVTEDLLRLDKKKSVLEKVNFDKMFRWITSCQDIKTGLISHPGISIPSQRIAFTYDQALAAQIFVKFSDFEKAAKIFEFFSKKAKKNNGLFFSVYSLNKKINVEQYPLVSPNLWLGIAILNYTEKSSDKQFIPIVESMAAVVGKKMPQNYMEENLDAYVFFNMLYKSTGKQEYLVLRDNIFKWIFNNYPLEKNIRSKNIFGQANIRTNTFIWSILTIGPAKLIELGINPDQIIEEVEKDYIIEAPVVLAKELSIKIKGFNFYKSSNKEIVSSEMTAQLILIFKKMVEFYRKNGLDAKAISYERKADEFLYELCNMIISSPQSIEEGYLPYSNIDNADTGHGWIAQKAKSMSSVSATAFAIFAYYGYNPLDNN